MNRLIDIFKGMAIGVSNVIAGLSGGSVAVILGVYQKIINACSMIFKHPIRVIKEYYGLFLGMVIGIIVGIIGIGKLYEAVPLPLSLFFFVLVLAGMPMLFKVVKHVRPKAGEIIPLIISFAIMVILPFLTAGPDKELSLGFFNVIVLVMLGFVSAASMVIPGVSGSMVLASIGYYSPILNLATNTITDFLTFDMTNLLPNLILCISFVLGCAIGIVVVSMLIKFLFKKWFTQSYYAIMGLVLGSGIAIIKDGVTRQAKISKEMPILWSVLAVILGLAIAALIFIYQKKHKDKQDYFVKASKEVSKNAINKTMEFLKFKTILDKFDPMSLTPFGEENKKALDFLIKLGKDDGFLVKNVDNYAIHIEYGAVDGELLGVLAHMDVVPVGSGWKTNPFEPKIIDGKIYARGAIDDKGPLMASYYAMKIIKDSKLPVSKRVRLICGCDEESGSRCLQRYFQTEEKPTMGFSPDADFPLIYGEKASCHFDILGSLKDSIIIDFKAGERYNIVPDKASMKLSKDVKVEFLQYLEAKNYKGEVKNDLYIAYGVSSHAMHPQQGVNAAFILIEFLNTVSPCELTRYLHNYVCFDPFGEKLGINHFDEDMKELTMNVGIIDIQNKKVRIGFDLRVPCDDLESKIKAKVAKSLEDYSTLQLNFGVFNKRHYVDPNSKLVRTLMDAYQSTTEDYDSKPFTIGGGTYAKFIENAVAFGPMFVGREDVVHQDNEYFSIDDFNKSVAIYAKAIYELIK